MVWRESKMVESYLDCDYEAEKRELFDKHDETTWRRSGCIWPKEWKEQHYLKLRTKTSAYSR